jgi:microcystin-dependent protein
MSEPFLGQIEIFGFGYAPRAWASCAGQMLPITQNQALFALLGTTYGGDGRSTFKLPDLRGRVPVGQGNGPGGTGWAPGQVGGTEAVVLSATQVPVHNHPGLKVVAASDANNTNVPGPGVALAGTTGLDGTTALDVQLYVADQTPNAALNANALGQVGGQPHDNHMPSLPLNFCIALSGVFPSRT